MNLLKGLVWLIVASGLAASTCSILLKRYKRAPKQFQSLVDIPNARSSHQNLTLRGGGIGLTLGIVVGLFGFYMTSGGVFLKHFPLFLGLLSIALLGFMSDLFNLNARIRFLAQIFIASIVFFPLSSIHPVFYFAAVLWMTSMVNFYNFMDGIDGLAATQAVVSGIALALFAKLVGNTFMFFPGLVLASTAAGFLLFNFPPAKIFMGDVGSYTLGFYIAYFAVQDGRLFLPMVLVLSVFLFDTITTLIRRILKGEPFYAAHRGHFYQRAIQLGYTHQQVTLAVAFISIGMFFLGMLYVKSDFMGRGLIIFTAFGILMALSWWIHHRERKKGMLTRR